MMEFGFHAMSILPLLTLGLLTIAIVLLRLGLRGRRVGDHPYCRRCGYDLFGQPVMKGVCPECGSGLEPAKATVIGQRRRQPMLVIGGGLFLLAAVAIGTRATLAATRDIDWYQYRPGSWLVADVRLSPPNFRSLAELTRRCTNQTLSDANLSAAVAVALAAQKDRTIAWNWAWGDLIEAAHRTGRLPAADWKTYLQQAILPTFTFKSNFDLASPIVLEFGTTPASLGSGTSLWTDILLNNLTVDGKPAEAQGVLASRHIGDHSSGWSSTDATLAYAGRTIGPGKHTFNADVTMTISYRDIQSSNDLPPLNGIKPATPAFLVPSKYAATFEILAEDTPPPDAASRKGMRDAIHIRARHSGDTIVLTLSTERLPMAMAARLWVKNNDNSESAIQGGRPIRLTAGDQSIEATIDNLPWVLDRKSVDLIMKPDDNTFRRDMGGVWLWTEEILIDHVPIEPDSP